MNEYSVSITRKTLVSGKVHVTGEMSVEGIERGKYGV